MRVLLAPLLLPLVLIYRLLASLHRGLYRWGLRPVVKLSKPVVSVGNLTVGGTGKTAIVDHLLTQLEAKGLKCCVLTRGYGRKSRETLVVSDNSTASEVGDEPLWLHQRHPRAKIVVSQERAKAATSITDVDLFIMDDGFQHYELQRDYEIILIDSTRPDWHYRLLPMGFARESWSSLRRADMVVLTRANQASPDRVDWLADRIFDTALVDVSQCFISFERCKDLRTGQPVEIKGRKAFLVSGIANPESFEKLVKEAGVQIAEHEILADHAVYDSVMINEFLEQAQRSNAQMVLTTEKDAVKWREILKTKALEPSSLQVGVVSTSLEFDPPLESIYEAAAHHFH